MSILELRSASFSYGAQTVVEDVSVTIDERDSLGLVGESGAGKSTILRILLGLAAPQHGGVWFDDAPLNLRDKALVRRFRAGVQPVFQDPYSSLDPRQRIDRIVGEPLRSLRIGARSAVHSRVAEALASVNLDADTMKRHPHEFSGGQRQRIAIARAIVSRPRVLPADEPVSALDVTTRVQVIDLLVRLRHEHGLALVMVSHDLGAVAAVCERTIVLRAGRVVESAPTRTLLSRPATEYARALVGAVPRLPR